MTKLLFWDYFAADAQASLGHNLDNGRLWTNSIPVLAFHQILLINSSGQLHCWVNCSF